MSKPDNGKVYWQDDSYVHVEDRWQEFGQRMADKLEMAIRRANSDGGFYDTEKPICPACYMLIAYNMLVNMAKKNGQTLEELQASMLGMFESMDFDNPFKDSLEVMCHVE